MTRKSLKVFLIAAAGALTLAGATQTAARSPQDEGAASRQVGKPKYEDIAMVKSTAAQAQARINRSEPDKAALGAAARSKSEEQARAVLMRNGFTAEQLKGVPISFEQGGGAGGGEAAKIKKIEIRVNCCPLSITIIITLG